MQHPRAKQILRVFDHSAILLLIAGTYTPFTLISLKGPWGWSLFGTIWGLALLGIVLEVTRLRRMRVLLITLYLVMGWAVVVAINPMFTHVPPVSLWLLLAGGPLLHWWRVFLPLETVALPSRHMASLCSRRNNFV